MWHTKINQTNIKSLPPAYKKHQKNPSKANYILRGIMETCVEFCSATSLHGFNQIFHDFKDTNNMFLRKIQQLTSFVMWLLIVVIGTMFALYLIYLVWIRYETTPTITTIETNNYPIWNIAFPAVSFCNINVVHKPRTVNLTAVLKAKGFPQKNIDKFFQSLSSFIDYKYVDYQTLEMFEELEKLGYTSETILDIVSQPCENMIVACSWLGEVKNCSTLFKRSKSSHGYCCSFNYHYASPAAINSNPGKPATADSSHIIHVSGAGEEVGLRVLLNVDVKSYMAARKPFYGIQVFVHDPDSYPDVELTGTIAQVDKEYSIMVRPAVIYTRESLRYLNPVHRGCFFDNEKKLKISDEYSYEACMTECRIDTILEKCRCVPLFYPAHCNNTNCEATTRHCTLRDARCLRNNERVFLSLEPPAETKLIFNQSFAGMTCNCLPLCTDKEYDFQAIVSDRFDNANLTFYQLVGDKGAKDMAVAKVYFWQTTCILYRRDVFLSWDGLFAYFGGIFGLCLGGSLISLTELIYFSTIKFYGKFQKYKAEHAEMQRKMLVNINFRKAAFQASQNAFSKGKHIVW